MKTPNSVSQKIWILLKTNTKKGFLEILANWKVWTWKVWACSYSTQYLVGAPFAWITAAMRRAVVGKVHRSSTWVKVQIGIIKYYSSKSKSTAFSILLEWKYKSTQFLMYLSKKVLIDRFILQFYIDYFIKFYISTYLYNPTAQNTWVFPKITTI